jgi:glycerophosphoryl diester phosphodiesterase
MPDNGFGGKANSRDFLIRAYYATPDFKTARVGPAPCDR